MRGEHPWLIVGALLVALATPVLGIAPETSPRPEARPEAGADDRPRLSFGETPAGESGAKADGQEAASAMADDDAVEDSGEDAEDAEGEEAEDVAAPEDEAIEPEAPPPPPLYQTVADTPDARRACLAELERAGVEFTALPAIDGAENRDCGILHPIEVSAIAPDVALSPPAVLRCETALATSRWVRDWLRPAAARLPELGALRGLRHGSAYVCRDRASGAKLSEHALGNALDVMAVEFENATLDVVPRAGKGDRQEALQRTIRAAACLEFTTVIGPGTDEAHADHLHLDVKRRNRDYRLCQ